jgi:alpha-glucosidase
VDAVQVKQAGVTGKGGWSYVGNTLTTIVPVSSKRVASAVTIEVRRTAGLTAHRNELDGFAGAMTRLRGSYEALLQTGAISASPTLLIDAMQTGDRISYHPERTTEEIAHFHNVMIAAQASVTGASAAIAQKLDDNARRLAGSNGNAAEIEAQKQHRLDIAKRAEVLVKEAGK